MASSKYVKQTHYESILNQPDMYIGATSLQEQTCWLLNTSGGAVEEAKLTMSPGLY